MIYWFKVEVHSHTTGIAREAERRRRGGGRVWRGFFSGERRMEVETAPGGVSRVIYM